jgi:hypothetical protein
MAPTFTTPLRLATGKALPIGKDGAAGASELLAFHFLLLEAASRGSPISKSMSSDGGLITPIVLSGDGTMRAGAGV